MATLKAIATEICDSLDRPYDGMFLERVMVLVRYTTAKLLRESVKKYGADRQFTLRYKADIERVSDDDMMYIDEDTPVYRTTNKIFTAIRDNEPIPFTYVGSKDGFPFTYRNRALHNFASFLLLSGKGISYDVINNYLYIFNNSRVKEVHIEAIWENPIEIIKEIESGKYTDKYVEEEYSLPIPEDMIDRIKAILLSGELSITDDKDKVVATHIDNN